MIQLNFPHYERIDACDKTGVNRFLRQIHLARYWWAVRELQNKNNGVILDAACGVGYGTKILSELGRVRGIDISYESIEYARNRYNGPNVDFLLGNIGSEDFWKNFKHDSIDAIVSFETLEHCQDPEKVLNNYYRVLKESGILLLSTPNGLYEREDVNGRPYNSHHVCSYTPKELHNMVLNSGFSEVQMYGQGPIYGFVMGYLRKLLDLIEKGKMNENINETQNAIGIKQETKIYRRLTGLRDWIFDLTGVVDILTRPRSRLVYTVDNLIIKAKK